MDKLRSTVMLCAHERMRLTHSPIHDEATITLEQDDAKEGFDKSKNALIGYFMDTSGGFRICGQQGHRVQDHICAKRDLV